MNRRRVYDPPSDTNPIDDYKPKMYIKRCFLYITYRLFFVIMTIAHICSKEWRNEVKKQWGEEIIK